MLCQEFPSGVYTVTWTDPACDRPERPSARLWPAVPVKVYDAACYAMVVLTFEVVPSVDSTPVTAGTTVTSAVAVTAHQGVIRTV